MKKQSEVKEECLREIYLNVLKAIIIVLYFFVLNLSYENLAREHLLIGIKIFTMIFLFISIYIFERAYKKDDEKLAIQGIEILVLATYTLTTEHITNKFDFNFKSYSLVASYVFAIYFILKSIVIYTKGRKEVVEELSDIREIVQKKEPIKKEATKKAKKENNNVEKMPNKEDIEIDKNKKIENHTKKSVKKKKKKVEKKEDTKEEVKVKKEHKEVEKTSKVKKENIDANVVKRKPVNKTKDTSKIKKESNDNLEEKPKRKKVKKEVTEND